MANEELQDLLRKMADTNASDLFLTTGAPPYIKVNGESWPLFCRPSNRITPGCWPIP
jgi:Tfp pilus assembly ATPase PilU